MNRELKLNRWLLDMIETENLTRKFGDLTAVDNLTLRVDKGEVSVFLVLTGQEKPQPLECFAA